MMKIDPAQQLRTSLTDNWQPVRDSSTEANHPHSSQPFPVLPQRCIQGLVMCASSQSWGFSAVPTQQVTAGCCDLQLQSDWPPDAESCCGDTPEETRDQLLELACFVTGQASGQPSACCCPAASQDCVHAAMAVASTRQCGSYCSGSSSMMDSDTECGDDFECLAGEDASMLLEDASIEYPGGVDAALADWAAACSREQPPSASACLPGAELANTTLMLPAACWQQQQQQHRWQQQQQHEATAHAARKDATLPSMAAVLLTQTQPPCLAACMLPCCQWGAFEGDAVGDVLAGRVPAPSCCTSLLHY